MSRFVEEGSGYSQKASPSPSPRSGTSSSTPYGQGAVETDGWEGYRSEATACAVRVLGHRRAGRPEGHRGSEGQAYQAASMISMQ